MVCKIFFKALTLKEKEVVLKLGLTDCILKDNKKKASESTIKNLGIQFFAVALLVFSKGGTPLNMMSTSCRPGFKLFISP